MQNDPFANLGNAKMPNSRGKNFTHGDYLVEVNLFACKNRQAPNAREMFVLLEATVLRRFEPAYENSIEVGERASTVFMFQASGWAGEYATGDMKCCMAAMLGADFDDIESKHALHLTGYGTEVSDGTKSAGLTMRMTVSNTDKTDDKGAPYTNIIFSAADADFMGE